MAPIPIGDMFLRILRELDIARNAFSDAASWARSDWSDYRSLTDAEAEARQAVFAAIDRGKAAIDQAKGAISRTWSR